MPSPFTEDVLLISSPNQGGMALVSNNRVTVLDQDDCTGIWISEDTLFRNVIVGLAGSRSMQLQSFSASRGKKVLAVDMNYDFHDILVHEDQLYLVSTGTNEVIVLDLEGNKIRRYAYPGRQDSWHINCLSLWDGKVVLSAFGEFESHRGYKHHSHQQGFVIDIETNNKLWEGLSQPHTPVQHESSYFVCNSEEKQVLVKDALSTITCLQFDGYTRGIAFSGDFMYVGLSQSRNITPGSAGKTSARIVALDISTFERCGEISLPFSEIYDLRIIRNSSLLPTIMLSLNGILLKHELEALSAELQIRSQQLDNLSAQFQRVNAHVVAGPVLRLLRWLKHDETFGNPDICQNIGAASENKPPHSV